VRGLYKFIGKDGKIHLRKIVRKFNGVHLEKVIVVEVSSDNYEEALKELNAKIKKMARM